MAAASSAKVFTIGLSSLQAGDVASDGTMQTTLAQHGNVYRDTLSFETSDPTVTEYFEEEVDKAVASEGTEGSTTITWEILRPSPADLLFWCGGSADGLTWSAPTGYVDKKLAIKITSKQGYVISVPKAQIVAATTGGGAKSTPMRLRVTATVLVPANGSGVDQPPLIYTAPSA